MEATSIDRRHSPPHGDCPPLLAGEVGKIPTPLFVEGPSRCRSTACGRSKSFSSMADPSRGGARRSKRGESYVAQFRGPCASLGHARPIVEHGVPIVGPNPTLILLANSLGRSERADSRLPAEPILPSLRLVGGRREFASSIIVGSGPRWAVAVSIGAGAVGRVL